MLLCVQRKKGTRSFLPSLIKPPPHRSHLHLSRSPSPATAAADTVATTPSPDKALTLPGATPLTFENAVLLGDATRVLWTKNADGSVSGAFDASSKGWAAFGYPGEGGSMLGGNVLIVTPDPTASGLASAKTANLAGYTPDKFVIPSPGLKVDGPLTAGIPSTGRIASTFTFPAASIPAGGKVMVAQGPMVGGKMGIHGAAAVADLLF